MRHIYVLVFVVGFLLPSRAQIFINTGNPNIEKYKKENPNAVIWDKGKEVPITKTPTAVAPTKTITEDIKPVEKTPILSAPVIEKPKPTVETPKENPVLKSVVANPVPANPVSEGNSTDYPPNAVPGRCYARCIMPDKYEFREEQVIDKPSSTRSTNVPAKYKTVFDTIVIKPETKKTVTKPAVYETVTVDSLVTPATQKWVKGKGDQNCLSANPKDCEVLCLVEVPAVYKPVTRKVEKSPAITTEEIVPAITRVMPRKVLEEASQTLKSEVPATYKTVMTKVLVSKGGYEEWREVLCKQEATSEKILAIQRALKNEGYDPGPLDNSMGSKTKEALVKFQQDKGLPIGNLNIETLKALGVSQ